MRYTWAMSDRIEVHLHLHLPEQVLAMLSDHRLLHEILATIRELKAMSETNQAIIDAANAKTSASLDAIQADITTITAELAAAIPQPGMLPSQASLDTLNANVARLEAVKAALDGLATPTPPPAPPTPAP